MMSSHHNFCQIQPGSDQIGSGDGRISFPTVKFKCAQKNASKGFGVIKANPPVLTALFSPLGSRFSTPRSMLKLSKKRALSISPLSDASVDLQTVIRTSPNSLVAFVNARCNPNGASSYGHLSVSAMRSDISLIYIQMHKIVQ